MHIIGFKIIEPRDLNSREEVFSEIEHIGRYIAKGLYMIKVKSKAVDVETRTFVIIEQVRSPCSPHKQYIFVYTLQPTRNR